MYGIMLNFCLGTRDLNLGADSCTASPYLLSHLFNLIWSVSKPAFLLLCYVTSPSPKIPLLSGEAELKVCLLLKTLMNVRSSEKQGYSQMGSQLGDFGGHTGKPQKRWMGHGRKGHGRER